MASPLSTAFVNPDAGAAEQSRKELQAKLTGLGGINGRQLAPEAKAKKLREACEGFESIFIQKMWQEMRNTIPKGALLQGREEKFWQDMYDQELSKSMTSAGGIGLADMMYEQLSRNLVSASRSTAGLAAGGAFTPTAAPLMPTETAMQHTESSSQPAVAANSVYSGQAPQMGAVQDEGEDAADEAQPVPPAEQTLATAVSKPQAAVPPIAPIPDHTATTRAAEVTTPRHTVKKADLGNSSGLEMAYLARREAGDKLGSHAVRPALHQNSKRTRQAEKAAAEMPAQATAQAAQQNSAPAHGTAQALAAALQSAQAGSEVNIQADTSLHDLVARVKAQNAAATSVQQIPAQAMAAPAAAEMDDAAEEPAIRKVRYTTNVPTKNRNRKNSQAIRMLNVDNTSINSKAGQGLAAYHAAQEAAKQTAPVQTAAAAPVAPVAAPVNTADVPVAPIAPLTAKQVSTEAHDADTSFNIPPLTAGGLKS